MKNHVICVRDVWRGKFVSEPGATRYLVVNDAAPEATAPAPLSPRDAIERDVWFKQVIDDALARAPAGNPEAFGDVLVFVHGYNNDQQTVLRRHRRLARGLAGCGYGGLVVTFDWPSAASALNYLEDRADAKATALALVDDALRYFVRLARPDCRINVHLLAHSTGAYVVREAFDDADDRQSTGGSAWTVSQVAFIGGDVSADSMAADSATSESVYRHCVRLTNYSNAGDAVLKLSNTKRLGMAPRVGRVGLPAAAPAKAINVDCSGYWQGRTEATAPFDGTYCHSWHIGDPVFFQDLALTLRGDLDRHEFPTRRYLRDNWVELQAPA